MDQRISPAQSSNLSDVPLTFIPGLSEVHYELFEIDDAILSTLSEQHLSIKSYEIDKLKTAALCSNDTTYKLKRSETSNTMLIAGLKSGNIYKQAQRHIALEKSECNKYQMAKLIS